MPARHGAHAASRVGGGSTHGSSPYLRLVAMSILSFAAMFLLMYAMVDRRENVLVNLNQIYMSLLMTAPMVVIELALMAGMYPDRRKRAAAFALSVLVFIAAWSAIRRQAAISDEQFLRSMIPHHAGALLMCREAKLSDPEILRLCDSILASQTREIALMKSKLESR